MTGSFGSNFFKFSVNSITAFISFDFLVNNPVSLDIARSTFTAHPKHITTMTEGDLVPVFFSEVLPGDTFSVDTSFLARMATPIFPVADNAFIDFFYFYVPNRIVWNHWKEFLGENTSAPWTQSVEYTIPQLKSALVLEHLLRGIKLMLQMVRVLMASDLNLLLLKISVAQLLVVAVS